MYTYDVWNKKSPINGVSAEDALQVHKITVGEVGLVLDEKGQVAVFQYDNNAPYSISQALEKVKAIAEQMNNPPVQEA